jgi:hypothetical protein
MKQKMYSVEVMEGCNLFVIAYSKEHAIVEIVRMNIKDKVEDYPSEYTIDDVKELSNSEMENIIIDYNYVTEDTESDTLLNIFKYLTKFEDNKEEFFGVVGDDYIAY